MKKVIVKELLIIVLLALVIVLTLRMVIYDFIPNERALPESIQYSADLVVEEVLREINFSDIENTTESLLKTYVIEESDLKDYVSKNGKTDPFTDYKENNKNTINR